jgi:anti-anti-sigma factor
MLMADSKSLASATIDGTTMVVDILADQLREGEIAYRLRDEINALIEQHKPAHIVLDLAQVRFIGSVGFLAFLGVRRHLGEGRIVLCNLSAPTRDIFAICNLIPTETKPSAPFELSRTRDEALTLLSTV